LSWEIWEAEGTPSKVLCRPSSSGAGMRARAVHFSLFNKFRTVLSKRAESFRSRRMSGFAVREKLIGNNIKFVPFFCSMYRKDKVKTPAIGKGSTVHSIPVACRESPGNSPSSSLTGANAVHLTNVSSEHHLRRFTTLTVPRTKCTVRFRSSPVWRLRLKMDPPCMARCRVSIFVCTPRHDVSA